MAQTNEGLLLSKTVAPRQKLFYAALLALFASVNYFYLISFLLRIRTI